jgi:hypothetical protein
MNDAVILHEGLRCAGEAPPSCYVSSIFVCLHYCRAKISFTAQPKKAAFFGTMFVSAARRPYFIPKNSEKKFKTLDVSKKSLENFFVTSNEIFFSLDVTKTHRVFLKFGFT